MNGIMKSIKMLNYLKIWLRLNMIEEFGEESLKYMTKYHFQLWIQVFYMRAGFIVEGSLMIREVYRFGAMWLHRYVKGKPRMFNGQRLELYIVGQNFESGNISLL